MVDNIHRRPSGEGENTSAFLLQASINGAPYNREATNVPAGANLDIAIPLLSMPWTIEAYNIIMVTF